MARKARTLIASPLAWQMSAAPIAHPIVPVLAERGGTQLRTPLPVVVVDTREQIPLSFRRFKGWFSGVEMRALPLGDYSVSPEWKTPVWSSARILPTWLVRSPAPHCIRQAAPAHERASSQPASNYGASDQVKCDYPYGRGRPNQMTQSLIGVLAGLRLPFVCTETHELGEEIVASYLYQTFLYDWLERNGHGRFQVDDDL